MRTLRYSAIAIALASILLSAPAGAESAIEAMTAFGLFGSWSLDCSKPISCNQKGCGSRGIYEVSPSGQPMNRSVTGSTTGQIRTVEFDIHAAARIGDDKIKMTWTQLPSSVTTLPWMRQPGERWEAVFIKSGNKYRTLSAKREDGKKIAVEDGFAVRPSPDTSPDQLPTSWVRTTNETPWFEKCTATADEVVLSGVTVRSAVSGYAVTFPSKPVEDVKDTPAGKLVINFARDGYTMFAASEATTNLPDTSTGLEASVASFVQSFPGAAVTSKQKTEFTAASGRALPAITFTFASPSHNFFGEGIVVAAGRYLISVVGTDMDTSTNQGGKRSAIKRFVSSLKIEK